MAINLDQPILRDLLHGFALVTRGMTLGVRGVAIDEQNRVCLVRHTYVRGWYLPGGGIEARETAEASMLREFREETGIVVDPQVRLRLHGFFLNAAHRGRDHIAVYVATSFTVPVPKRPDREIADCAFFSLNALPPDTTRGTRERLKEIAEGRTPSPRW